MIESPNPNVSSRYTTYSSSAVNVDLLPHHNVSSAESEFTRNLIDSIPALVAYIDCNMVLQYCNQSFSQWFSLAKDSEITSFPVICGKQIFSQLQRHMGKVLVGYRANFQMAVDTPAGFQYLDATLSPDFDHHRKVKGFIFHSSDITEKNRMERALKDYFENASIGFHWVNADGVIIWANSSELKMLGYAESEYVGHHISEFHANKPGIATLLDRLQKKEKIVNYSTDLICKDGSIKHVTLNSTVLWEGDKFVHTRCFTIDVTEQTMSARVIEESEERFRTMTSLLPLIVWTSDDNGEFNFLSVRWEQQTGAHPDDGLGSKWTKFIHPDERENVASSWRHSCSQKKTFEAKFRFRNVTGGYDVTYAKAIPRYSSHAHFIGYIGILQDVTSEEQVKYSLEKIVLERTDDLRRMNDDLRKAENALQKKNDELEKINNQLSSFAYIASHDLQEPLRKIQTFSERLLELEGNKFSERGKELFDRIHYSSSRMKTLIHDLLAYSKSSASEGNAENVDLNSMLTDVAGELEIIIGEKKALIEYSGLPELKVIRFQFHQLFLNLLGNALKFSRPEVPSHVIIKSEKIDGRTLPDGFAELDTSYHHISISDNGIGFDPQFAEKIFDIFQRLHGHSQFEGTGIGLAICKKIVDNHKGMIRAEGRPDAGSVFHIYLPA